MLAFGLEDDEALCTDPEMLDSNSMIWIRSPYEVISIYLTLLRQCLWQKI